MPFIPKWDWPKHACVSQVPICILSWLMGYLSCCGWSANGGHGGCHLHSVYVQAKYLGLDLVFLGSVEYVAAPENRLIYYGTYFMFLGSDMIDTS